jgi:hypothetical protein
MSQLLKSFFLSKLAYGLDVYTDVTTKQGATLLDKLQVWQNKACRAALGLRPGKGSALQLMEITELQPIKDIAYKTLARGAFELYGNDGKWKDLRDDDKPVIPLYGLRSKYSDKQETSRKIPDFQEKMRKTWNSLPSDARKLTRKQFMLHLQKNQNVICPSPVQFIQGRFTPK